MGVLYLLQAGITLSLLFYIMLTFTAFALHLLSSGFPYDHVRFFMNSETIVLTTRELKSSETHKTLVCLGLLLTSIFFSFLNVMIWIFFCRQSSINYDGWAEILVLRGCRCCDFGPALTFRTSFFQQIAIRLL